MNTLNNKFSETAESKNCIILLSGGMDSLVTLAYSISEEYNPWLVHLTYGQRTAPRELQAFNDLRTFYQIPVSQTLTLSVDFLMKIGSSSLTDPDLDIPDASFNPHQIPSTYVPFRNGNLISIAVAYADANQINDIFIGAVQADSSGYPDTRKDFIDKMEAAARAGTVSGKINLHTPLIDLSKQEIVKLGRKLKVPFHLSWSCYKNGDRACGECESCVLRRRAFIQAGFYDDPLPYEIELEDFKHKFLAKD